MRQVFQLVRQPVVHRDGAESFTPGRLSLDGLVFSHTCEDEDRFLEADGGGKIYGKTAIPRGKYRVVTSHSRRFSRILPEVLDVPGFSGIRIHGGNTAEDSAGCVLVGQTKTKTGVAKCAETVNRIIDTIDDAAELGIETWLEIT